ncbi:MAG: hypothetical protein ACOX3G_11295 [Armatimonadota bacterium]
MKRLPASLNRALKQGFRGAYDSLGYVIGASFTVFLASAAVFALMRFALQLANGIFGLLFFIPVLFVGWIGAVGIFYYVKKVIFHENPSASDTLTGIRSLFWPATMLFVVDVIVTAVLTGNIIFFALAFRANGGVLIAALGIVSAYIGLMWLLLSMYHLPVMMLQSEMESEPTLRKIIYKSFLLAADNPAFTVGLFVVIIAFTLLCSLPAMLGVALLLPGTVAFLLIYSLRELYIKYGIIEPEPEVIEDKPWTLDD